MNSAETLSLHLKIFWLGGLWPPERGSLLYLCWQLIFFSIVHVGFPVSALICVFYVESVAAVVDVLILTSTIVLNVVKACIFLLKRKQFLKLLKAMNEIDKQVEGPVAEAKMATVVKECSIISRGFFAFCMCCWVCVALQVTFSSPEERQWSSTYRYPSKFMHKRIIYVGGLYFQVICNLFSCVQDVVFDTYGACLLHVLGGHVDVLGLRLQQLGYDRSGERTQKLIAICKDYSCGISGSFKELIEEVLSFALLAQFYGSGLLICTCAYQLTAVSPSNVSKFIFIVSYSCCIILEIFVPSYFGSLVHTKSERLPFDVFQSNWVPASRQYKANMMILAERAMRPLNIKAANLFELGLPMFLKVLKSAYTLYAVMKSA